MRVLSLLPKYIFQTAPHAGVFARATFDKQRRHGGRSGNRRGKLRTERRSVLAAEIAMADNALKLSWK